MHKRYHAQRQHIVSSLESALYQLHTLSFFLSPSVLLYICRLFCQFVCSNPRELDANRSLRWFFGVIVLTHFPSLWTHAIHGASDGRALVLDFVGVGQKPSKFQLCSLDVTILLLQCLLTAITYETSAYYHSDESNAVDELLPRAPAATLNDPAFDSPLASPNTPSYPPKPPSMQQGPPLVLDFQMSSIKAHLTTPPAASRPGASTSPLPLPNTTPFPLPTGFRLLMRARRQVRETRNTGETAGAVSPPRRAGRDRQLPGSIDLPE